MERKQPNPAGQEPLSVQQATDLYCQGRSTPATCRSYSAALQPFLILCSDQGVELCSEVTPGLIARLPSSLAGLAPATRRHRLAVSRSFLRYAGEAGWSRPGCSRALSLGGRVGPGGLAPWTADECLRLIAAEPTWRGRALLWVLVSTGARIGEVVAARIGDFDGECLGVTGKTGTRAVPLCPQGRRALIWYLRHRQSAGPESPLFAGRQGALGERQARNLVHAACRRAGLQRRGPHAFRHAAAARWLRAGIPLAVVSAALGHSRPSTTLDLYRTALAADLARGLSADPLWEVGGPPGPEAEMGEEAA